MSWISRASFRHLILWVAAPVLAIPFLAGCSGTRKPEADPAVPLEAGNAQRLEAGYTVTIEFVADGSWAPSGFEAVEDDEIVVETVGAARTLSREALQMHIGKVTRFVEVGKPHLVTQRGEILFRVEPRRAGRLREQPVRVKISNVREPAATARP